MKLKKWGGEYYMVFAAAHSSIEEIWVVVIRARIGAGVAMLVKKGDGDKQGIGEEIVKDLLRKYSSHRINQSCNQICP